MVKVKGVKVTNIDNNDFFLSKCATIKEFLKNGIDTIRNIDFPKEGKLLNAMFSLS
jgi:hypothetical protein